jgi:hypothetical protein
MADQDWKDDGLKQKYYIAKTDGSSTNAEYFVLRIDRDDNDKPHDPHAIAALHKYADSVEEDNSQLATDLRKYI